MTGVLVFDRSKPGRLPERHAPPVVLGDFFGAGMRAMFEAQDALAEKARESLVAWEERGIPPTAFSFNLFRLGFPVAYGCEPREAAKETSALTIAPRHGGVGALSLGIRYVPTPQGSDEPPEE